MEKLVVICGPTATGKSGLAMAIAQRLQQQGLHSSILSADSRQVYRGFDIGTAKPSGEDRQQVPHHLIDICDPTETLTLGDFQQQAQGAIAQLHRSPQASCPLLVGGTGLYIKSVVRGLKIPRVPPQPELRSQLEGLGQRHNYAQLQAVDPVAAAKIHPHDQVRTLRALEVFYVTGNPISQQQGENPPDYPILQLGLDCFDPVQGEGRRGASVADRLAQRIGQRAAAMVKAGLVEEVAGLRDRYGPDLPLLQTLGYAEISQFLQGEIDLEQATALTALHTRQFAKRQRTWFRAIPAIEWFEADGPDLVDQVWQRIVSFIAVQGPEMLN